MTDPLPRRIAWFAPWTWKRVAQVGLIATMGFAVIMVTWFYVMLYAVTHHAMD